VIGKVAKRLCSEDHGPSRQLARIIVLGEDLVATTKASIEKYSAAAIRRFCGSCESLVATPKDEGILFEFSALGAPARLEVHTGDLTPTKVRSAFIELGMEIGRLAAAREGVEF